ncbi:HEAT repeat domain-containing protein [Streptomyces sp. Act143]|uniref:HEAT repeat domain-containing protein n=1 Tax=Streptomyces sp. Act143 TaxID=2200760 RepID=UPI0015E817DA|nr:HEAT repeat domain-containing protein [Streptomyces sp. Act143]
MVRILIAHADGDEALAAEIAAPLEKAGYEVLHHGSLFVGDSLMQQASQAIAQGSPVILCGTVTAIGTGWANFLVNAARRHGEARIFALQMEKNAYLDFLTLDGRIARYWQDPARAMNELMEALSEYYPTRRPAGADPRLDQLEQRYRELTLETCDIVDLANLPIGDRDLITRDLQLRSLYVSLRVTVDIPPGIDPHDLDRKLQSLEARRNDHDDDTQDAGARFSVGERLADSTHLVVLGDPGAGKSTMLRWIATAYLLRLKSDPEWSQLPDVDTLPDTDWLPLFIRCRDLDERRITGSLEDMIQHHLCDTEFSSDEATELTPLLLRRLREGRALLLIDGLDEISDTALRARFCRKVEKIHLGFPEAPIIVTSRIVGYREMGLRITRGFEHVTVQDLTSEDKDDFARRWCVVTEPSARRDSAAQELISDIHSTDRIERLTGNPMLLTTMALVKKKVGKLPSRRADLYREAVDVLLHWRSDVDERMDPHEALPQLQYLAYAMCESGTQQIRQDEVIDVLERMRREFPAVHAVSRRSSVEFLRRLERQTGILVESGHVRRDGRLVPVYEFRHLTFQEYLAGLALVARRYPGRDRRISLADHVAALTSETSVVTTSMEHLDEVVSDNWREAIRLCVMTCNDDDVDSVLRAIATPRSAEAPATARPRATLACACLADEPNASKEAATEIVTRFVAALTAEDGTGPSVTVADTVLREMGGSRWAALLSRTIVTHWLENPSQHERLAGPASLVLGQTAPKEEEEALTTWVRNQVALLDEPEPAVAVEAALALMDLAYSRGLVMEPGLLPGLISMLTRGPCEATAAAWALGWTKMSSMDAHWADTSQELAAVITSRSLTPAAVMYLLWCFDQVAPAQRDDMAAAVMDAFVAATEAGRKQLGDSYCTLFPDVVAPVVRATGHPRYDVRLEAALLLKQLDGPQAVKPLSDLLTDEEGAAQREVVVRALAELNDSRAVEPLFRFLRFPDGTTNPVVASALGVLRDPRALPPLLDVLPRTSGMTRAGVVSALGRLRDPRAVEPLLALLVTPRNRPDPAVAKALGEIGDARAVEPLLGALPKARGDARMAVVEALGLLGDARAVEPLLTALTQTSDDAASYTEEELPDIVRAIVLIGDPGAARRLSELRTEEDRRLDVVLTAALGALGDTTARRAVHEAMAHSDKEIRRKALWSLATLERDEVTRVLLSRDHDGIAPGLDPQDEIEESSLGPYARILGLPVREVRSRYEELAERFPLTLGWRPPPA